VPSIRTIFLSSTGADLREYRDAAFRAIQKLDGWKCVRMEDSGPRDSGVDTFCREQAQTCDLFIGIIGHRFGDGPMGSRESFTQREYRAAVDAKRPRLLFLAPDKFPIAADLQEAAWKIKAQAKFRAELRESKDRIVSIGFANPDDLANQIVTAIYNWQNDKPSPDATRYLNALWEDTAYIEIRGLRVSNDAVYKFRIDELYTPLTTVLAQEKRKKEEELASHKAVPLQQALENRRVLLVGDPGAGKSTFLRRIGFAACETLLARNPSAAAQMLPATPCPFPLLIRAASLANHVQLRTKGAAAACPTDHDSPEWLIHYLHASAHENKWDLHAEFFREQLERGCLLLFDGLDEVPDRLERKAMARLLELTARAYEKTQVVATSRPLAYGGETVIPGFAAIQIGPLEDEAVETFVGNWCRALHPAEEKASGHQAELLSAIRSQPEIQAMAVNPVMLTALAALHWNRTRLPDQRSELYESVLAWLAQAREEKRKARMPALQCVALMEHLAYMMQTDSRGKQVEITRHAAARVLALRPPFRDAEEPERFATAERFLEEEETDSGILVSRGNTLRYWHLTFQEYLAAKALAWRDADRERLLFAGGKLYLPEWKETVLLLAGVLCKQDSERVDAFLKQVLDGLGNNPSLADIARCVGLIGRILQDLNSWNYRIADGRYRQYLDRVLEIFEPRTSREIDFRTRLEAADALGQAGDPRLEQDNWVRVEAGSFWMGAQKKDPNGRNYDADAYDDELPVHRVDVASFQIGRYPVTVDEYARFMTGDGYERSQLWRAGGFGQFSQPEDWQQQLRNPNRPVVGVSWFEAAAWCASAGGRLPTEAEWEYVARSGRDYVRYPWGDEEPDEFRANFGNEPGHSTPVGLYPEGATPSGIQDLSGNVWEWVANGYRPYSEARQAEGQAKVIRGGSWYYVPGWLRASSRSGIRPVGRSGSLGFRCARELLSL
jgi:formylglycine-generating enzyme required for sulfatase activity